MDGKKGDQPASDRVWKIGGRKTCARMRTWRRMVRRKEAEKGYELDGVWVNSRSSSGGGSVSSSCDKPWQC